MGSELLPIRFWWAPVQPGQGLPLVIAFFRQDSDKPEPHILFGLDPELMPLLFSWLRSDGSQDFGLHRLVEWPQQGRRVWLAAVAEGAFAWHWVLDVPSGDWGGFVDELEEMWGHVNQQLHPRSPMDLPAQWRQEPAPP